MTTSPPATLTTPRWQLQRVSGPDQPWFETLNPVLPEPVHLFFRDQRLIVTGVCNPLSADYTLAGEAIHVSHPLATMRACAETALMEMEDAVGRQLPNARRWSLDAPTGAAAPMLALHFADGSTWQLQGQASVATPAGSAP